MKPKKRRTDRAISTAEGAVLKQLRKAQGLSMREAGKLIGRSDSYISHIETGRLDVPCSEELERLLYIYGKVSIQDFQERVYLYQKTVGKKEELYSLIEKMSEEKVEFLNRVSGLLLRKEEATTSLSSNSLK